MNKLMNELDNYLSFRRGLGFKLTSHASILRDFVRFLGTKKAEYISTQLAVDWAQQAQSAKAAHRARRLGMARDFALYVSARDSRTEIPPNGLLSGSYERSRPFIYTEEQILHIITQASALKGYGNLRPHTYCTLFGLLAVTGMRISEIIALDRDDVDLTKGILTVRQAKFGKSRFIPVHDSTVQKLKNYVRLRNRFVKEPLTTSFFISDRGVRLTNFIVRATFIKLSRCIGLRGPTDSHGPRIHDLRHTFAVNTLIKWHRDGGTTQQRLPLLSTYLGHAKVSDTYWYLTAVPELMVAVNKHLEKYLGDLI